MKKMNLYLFALSLFLALGAFSMTTKIAYQDGFIVSGTYKNDNTITPYNKTKLDSLRFKNATAVSATYDGPSYENLDPHMQRLIFSYTPPPKEESIASFNDLVQQLISLDISGSGDIFIDDTKLSCHINDSKIVTATILEGKIRHEGRIYSAGSKYIDGLWENNN